MTPIQTFIDRRKHLLSKIQHGVAIIATSPERYRNRDTHYPYRFDSYFYYLTGFREPEAVLILVATGDANTSQQILFCRDKDIEREIWDGFRYGPEAAREVFGFDAAHSISRLDELVGEFLADQPAVFHAFG
ncbi:MAG: Xaa-Pro aminopeptidase, partial [Nitrosomonas sp.]|nr:Xaa-Pro aminopeptidase [Nitrosomonas sp.]